MLSLYECVLKIILLFRLVLWKLACPCSNNLPLPLNTIKILYVHKDKFSVDEIMSSENLPCFMLWSQTNDFLLDRSLIFILFSSVGFIDPWRLWGNYFRLCWEKWTIISTSQIWIWESWWASWVELLLIASFFYKNNLEQRGSNLPKN